MLENNEPLNRTIGEIASSKIGMDDDSFREIYWNPCDSSTDEQVAVVVARGAEAVAMVKEAMGMLRDDNTIQRSVEIITDGPSRTGAFSGHHDVPSNDLSHQRNPDLDIVLKAISDIVRTYPSSPCEQIAIRTCHATCSSHEEILSRSLAAIVKLMDTSEDVDIQNVAKFLSRSNRLSWFLRQLVNRLDV